MLRGVIVKAALAQPIAVELVLWVAETRGGFSRIDRDLASPASGRIVRMEAAAK